MTSSRELPLAPFSLEHVKQAVDMKANQKANRERLKRRKQQIGEILELSDIILKDHSLPEEEVSGYEPEYGRELVARSRGVPVDLGYGSNMKAEMGVTKTRSKGFPDLVFYTIDIRLPDGQEGSLFKIEKYKNVEFPNQNILRASNRLRMTASDADLMEALKWLRFIKDFIE